MLISNIFCKRYLWTQVNGKRFLICLDWSSAFMAKASLTKSNVILIKNINRIEIELSFHIDISSTQHRSSKFHIDISSTQHRLSKFLLINTKMCKQRDKTVFFFQWCSVIKKKLTLFLLENDTKSTQEYVFKLSYIN